MRLALGVQAAVALGAALQVGISGCVGGVPGGFQVVERRLNAHAGDERRARQAGHLTQFTHQDSAAAHVGQLLAPPGAAAHAAGRDNRVTAELERAGKLVEYLAKRQACTGPGCVEEVGARVPGSKTEDGRRRPDTPAARPEERIAGEDSQGLGTVRGLIDGKSAFCQSGLKARSAQLGQVIEPVERSPRSDQRLLRGPIPSLRAGH